MAEVVIMTVLSDDAMIVNVVGEDKEPLMVEVRMAGFKYNILFSTATV